MDKLDELYIQQLNEHLQAPQDQGDCPEDIPVSVTTAQWSELLMQHKAQTQLLKRYKAIIQCIYNWFQAAINKHYLAKLDNPHVRLANIKPINIYNHIVNQYATMNLKMAEKNQKVFNEPMDLAKPLTVYNKKQKKCQALAADTVNPITMVDMVQTVTHAAAMVIMWDAYGEWKHIPQNGCI